MSLTEKFQITVPVKSEGSAEFVSFESVRVRNHVKSGPAAKMNEMPKVDLQDLGGHGFATGYGGDTDVSDGVTDATLKEGFKRKTMAGDDDQYSGEHIDLFYGEVEDEKGNVGFVERNNYLDRI